MLISSETQPSEWPYASQHARRVHNLTPSINDPSITKHEAFYGVKPHYKDLHSFGAPVVIKALPKPTIFQPRGMRGRWFGYAGENGTSVHLISVKCTMNNGTTKTKVVRSRDVRFLDAAVPTDHEHEDRITVLTEDNPIFNELIDVQGR